MSNLKCSNTKDTGSLNVGNSAGREFKVGEKIQILSEGAKIRTITYVMGKGEKQHLCFKGQGPVPLAESVEYRVLGMEAAPELEQEAA